VRLRGCPWVKERVRAASRGYGAAVSAWGAGAVSSRGEATASFFQQARAWRRWPTLSPVTNSPPRRHGLLAVHAHPDDETIGTGGTLARYAAEGRPVTLVTCTLGEEGEVLVPELAGLAAAQADQLGGYRLAELAAACRALGITDYRLLGGVGRYRDSGMMGTSANDHPRCFWRADLEVAAAELAAVIREVQPAVLVTYDPNGLYGHPDHIQAHRVAMRAVELAAEQGGVNRPSGVEDEGSPRHDSDDTAMAVSGTAEHITSWRVPKVYWTAVPRSLVAGRLELFQRVGGPFRTVRSLDDLPFLTPDEEVTTAIDISAASEAKRAALSAHASQITPQSWLDYLMADADGAFAPECYRRVAAGSDPSLGVEADIFAGCDGLG
jgi:N-acetyl-1-D-myo-inositol-2-amino-2-deoxy-alpha-D-glucopyranoside deacetylase